MVKLIAKERTTKKLCSLLFLSIFYCKMLISIAPIILPHLDAASTYAVIMQLEIEDNAKPTDVKLGTVKEYLTAAGLYCFSPEVVTIEPEGVSNGDHAKHLQAFYPPVPTPPPNV